MENVSREQLEEWIHNKDDILLIDILSKEDFDKRSIPGSINVPFKNNANFISDVERRLLSKQGRIILYCANKKCTLSSEAAQKLDNAGFANIYVLKEGVEGWLGKPRDEAA